MTVRLSDLQNTWQTFDTVDFMLEEMVQNVCSKGDHGVSFVIP